MEDSTSDEMFESGEKILKRPLLLLAPHYAVPSDRAVRPLLLEICDYRHATVRGDKVRRSDERECRLRFDSSKPLYALRDMLMMRTEQ